MSIIGDFLFNFFLFVLISIFVLYFSFVTFMHTRQTEVVLKNESNNVRKLNIGYSWSMLVFSFFVPLLKSDWRNAIMLFIYSLLTAFIACILFPINIFNFYLLHDAMFLLFIPSIVFSLLLILVPQIIYAFFYNRSFFQKKFKEGYYIDNNKKLIEELERKGYLIDKEDVK